MHNYDILRRIDIFDDTLDVLQGETTVIVQVIEQSDGTFVGKWLVLADVYMYLP